MKESITIVARDGLLRMRYDDRLTFKGQAAQQSIRRASHVEPTEDGNWTADMAPMGGPVLGPFPTRKAALQAEAAWIDARL